MAFHFIKSRLAGMAGTKPLGSALVIDIKDMSQQPNAVLQTFGQKSPSSNPDTFNEQWEFIPHVLFQGYFYIKSRLDGSFIDNPALGPTLLLTSKIVTGSQAYVFSQNYAWRFIQDPAGSGFCFIQSLLSGYVISISNSSDQERAPLEALPLKSAENPNQLWQASFPSPVTLPTILPSQTFGTGSGTIFSDANECSFWANLTIEKSGHCHFWGSYTNRGDVFAYTAPPQVFAVAIVVHDVAGNGYNFCFGGFVVSAPQQGCTAPWGFSGPSAEIANNWTSIAARAQASCSVSNTTGGDSNALQDQLQGAVTGAGGGDIGQWGPTPLTIFEGSSWAALPGMSVMGSYDGAVGYGPPGWLPDGYAGEPA